MKLPYAQQCHITQQTRLIAPATAIEDVPTGPHVAQLVPRMRAAIAKVFRGEDDRLVVVVGPCSIHDPSAALEYATCLAALHHEVRRDLLLVMRTYFEKPRTTVGWKGLINDPHLDESFAVNDGIALARRLLRDIVSLGVPTGCEFLDAISPQYLADVVCWGAIGARTAESQLHRELASGLSMPVGFKNGTDGHVDTAVEGVISAAHPHSFLGINAAGQASIVATTGNRDCHIILRGGKSGPNYAPTCIDAAKLRLQEAGLLPRVMVDVSHGNSGKDHRRQLLVAKDVGAQIALGQQGIFGLMMESFLVEGAQRPARASKLRYGQSVTDACLGWEQTRQALLGLADAVQTRRQCAAASTPLVP